MRQQMLLSSVWNICRKKAKERSRICECITIIWRHILFPKFLFLLRSYHPYHKHDFSSVTNGTLKHQKLTCCKSTKEKYTISDIFLFSYIYTHCADIKMVMVILYSCRQRLGLRIAREGWNICILWALLIMYSHQSIDS